MNQLLIFLVQSTLLLGFSTALVALLRRHPRARLAISRGSLVGVLALVIVPFLLPLWRSKPKPFVPVTFATPIIHSEPAQRLNAQPAPSVTSSSAATTTTPVAPASRSLDLTRLLIPAYLLGLGLSASILVAGGVVLRRLRRQSSAVQGIASDLLTAVAKVAGIGTPTLRQSKNVNTPFVCGFLRKTILVPENWDQRLSGAEMNSILTHEVAHIVQRDVEWNAVARFMSVILWPQALLWLLRRQMTAASEELCDQRVVRSGVNAGVYAECLLDMRSDQGARPAPALAIGVFSSRPLLSKRVEALFDDRRSRVLRLSRLASALTAITIVALLGVSMFVFGEPPSASAAQAGEIEKYDAVIQIKDLNGKPAPASTKVYAVSGPGELDTSVRVQPVSNGSVEIHKGDFADSHRLLLYFVAGDGVAMEQVWPRADKLHQVQLQKSAQTGGLFYLPNGKPAVGLRIRVKLMLKGEREQVAVLMPPAKADIPGLSAVTDDEGRAELTHLPPNVRLELAIEDDRFAGLAYDQRITISPEGESEVPAITLKPASSIEGTVTKNGQPVKDVRVALQENMSAGATFGTSWAEALTDSNGHYALKRLSRGTYNVAIDTQDKEFTLGVAAANEGVKVDTGETARNVNFEIVNGAVIEGTVTDAAGNPLPNVGVGIYGPAHPNSSAWVQMAKTDAKGHFRTAVPPGKQRVYTMDGEDNQASVYVTVNAGATAVANLRLGHQIPEPRTVRPHDVEPLLSTRGLSKTAAYGPGAPFYGPYKLRTGGSVSLDFVQVGKDLWSPDGSAAPVNAGEQTIDMSHFDHNRDSRIIYTHFKFDGLSRGEYYCLLEVPHQSSNNVWQSYGTSGSDRAVDLGRFTAPADLGQTDVKLGVVSGPYKTFATLKSSDSKFNLKIGPSREQFGSVGGPAPTATISVVLPPELRHSEVRLQAFRRDGREMNCLIISTGEDDADERDFTYSGGSPEDVDRVVVGYREYEWITFKGVHLYPNKRTWARLAFDFEQC